MNAVSVIVAHLRLMRLPRIERGSGSKRPPLGEGGRAAGLISLTIDKIAFVVEMVVDRVVDGLEFLECLYSAKPQHRPLSSL